MIIEINKGDHVMTSQISWKRLENLMRTAGEIQADETLVSIEVTQDYLQYHVRDRIKAKPLALTKALKLSAKALRHEARAFEKHTGISPATDIRVLCVLSPSPSAKCHHFYYVDVKDRTTSSPEFRKIDSFFKELPDGLGFKPRMDQLDHLKDLFTPDVWSGEVNKPQSGRIGKMAKALFEPIGSLKKDLAFK